MDAMEIEDVDFARMQTLVPDDVRRALGEDAGVPADRDRALAGAPCRARRSSPRCSATSTWCWRRPGSWRQRPPRCAGDRRRRHEQRAGRDRAAAVVAALPNGALVLPGLDQTLDEESWTDDRAGASRASAVRPQEAARCAGRAARGRAAAARRRRRRRRSARAQRWSARPCARPAPPSAGTGSPPRRDKKEMAQALAGVAVLEAPSAEDEAEAIALILREAAETPGRTAALVVARPRAGATCGRHGSRRGACASRTSAGQPFAKTAAGAFLDLVVEAAATRFEPVALMALLKHPLCRLGLPAGELRRAAARARACRLPRALLRPGAGGRRRRRWSGRRPTCARASAAIARARLEARGLEGRAQAGAGARRGVRADGGAVRVAGQGAALRDARRGPRRGRRALGQDRRATRRGRRLWQGEAGEEAAKFFASLLDREPARAGHAAGRLSRSSTAASSPTRRVRPRGPTHPRISIWEPYESRLQQPDVVDPGLAQRGHLAAGRRSRPLAQPADAADARAAGAGGAHRRCGPHLHLAAGRRPGLSHARRQGRRRADGALALAAAAAGAARRRCGHDAAADQPWLAWAQARNAAGRPGAARARARAAARRWRCGRASSASPPSRNGSPTPTPFSPSASWAWSRCRRSAGRRTRRCAARSCTTRWAALPRASPTALPTDVCAELVAFAEAGAGGATPARRASRPSGRRALPASPPGSPRRSPTRRDGVQRSLAEVEGKLVLAGPGRPLHAHGARRPHRRRRRRPRHHRLQDRQPASRTWRAAPCRARRRSCRWRRRSPWRAALRGCPRRRLRSCATSRLRAASRRARSTPSTSATSRSSRAQARARARAADRRLRRRRHALSRAAAGPLQLPLRRLRPSRPRGGVVGRDGRGGVSMGLLFKSKLDMARAETRRNQAAAADPAASAWVSANAGTGKTHVLTMRVLRLLLAGTSARAHPGADLYQGRRRGDVEARVRAAGRVGDGRDASLKAKLAELLRPRADGGRDATGAPALRHRHRDARRPEGADHPRLLRAAAAALSARGRRAAGLRHPRRARAAARC